MRVARLIAGLIAFVVGLGYNPGPRPRAWSGQAVVSGVWVGTIDVAGMSLRTRVVFTPTGKGLSAAIDIPQQGASGLPLRNVRLDGTSVHFELPATAAAAVFEGTVSGTAMAGTITQGAATGRFSFIRTGDVSVEPPPPYGVEDVSFADGDVTLAGTLTIPEGKGPFPAVVMLTGSGAQSRDEDIVGFKIFKVIADHLTRHGIAVLRYDDRGVGGSTGSVPLSTTGDFSHDALAAMALLRARADIDAKRVGLFGHSEGGAAAALAATAPAGGPSFIVMLAGAGVSGALVTRQQVIDAATRLGATGEQLAGIVAAQEHVQALVESGAPPDQMVEAVRALMRAQLEGRPAAQVAAIGDIDAFINARINAATAGVMTPWWKFFVTFDPATALARVTCPVLAIFGGKDLQVPPSLHRPAIEKALSGNARVKVLEYPAANHLFQVAVTGQVSEDPTLEKALVPGLLDDVTKWIEEATGGG